MQNSGSHAMKEKNLKYLLLKNPKEVELRYLA
jgi:hypothetical protein